MYIKSNTLLPRHTDAVHALVDALQRENGQVLVRPPGRCGSQRYSVPNVANYRLWQNTRRSRVNHPTCKSNAHPAAGSRACTHNASGHVVS